MYCRCVIVANAMVMCLVLPLYVEDGRYTNFLYQMDDDDNDDDDLSIHVFFSFSGGSW